MTNKEAIKYLIVPTATSTKSSTEYLKQKEAYELAIKALEEKPQGEWGKNGECPFCSYIRQWEDDKFCGNCGADMRKGD